MSLDPACACGTCPDCGGGGAIASGPLDALGWRHSAVRERLLGRIGQAARGDAQPLAGLGTRSLDDPAIALTDAYAGSLHVLAWNAARLADDATLERSQDRQALVDLVGLTGYQPRPALSATTWLAYTLDDFPGAPTEVTIPAGNPVASVPGPGELPVTFETGAALVARSVWNRLTVVQDRARANIDKNTSSVELAGQSPAIKTGDRVLLALDTPDGTKVWLAATIAAVAAVAEGEPRTIVTLTGRVTLAGAAPLGVEKGQLVVLGVHTAAFGANAPDAKMLLRPDGGTLVPLVDGIDTNTKEWTGLVMNPSAGPAGTSVDLDGVRTEAVPGRLMLFDAGASGQATRISAAAQRSRADFGLSGKVTHVTFANLVGSGNPFNAAVRATPILVETLRLPLYAALVEADLPAVVTPDSLLVEGVGDLPPGHRIMLSGEALDPATNGHVPGAETLVVKACTPVGGSPARTRIDFTAAPLARYRAKTLALFGNVVAASHGSSAAGDLPELLGSGDANRSGQRFTLARSPLSELPAPVTPAMPNGHAPALEVRVGGRRYEQVNRLFGVPDGSRAYVVETGRDGKQAVHFAGRLPTAVNGITARYRAGGGAAGNVAAGRLTTAMAPVPGVRQVINPAPADGGSDAEAIEAIRSLAPAALRTFDRVVSLADHAAFASQFPGVGRAEAHALRAGMRSLVVVTIASSSLRQPSADLCASVAAGIRDLSPPGHGVRVQGYVQAHPLITLALAIDAAFVRADVEAAARVAIAGEFGATRRGFAQGLPASAVLAAVQSVAGVLGARLDGFQRADGVPADHGRLLAAGPGVSLDPVTAAPVFSLAEWLWIDPALVTMVEMEA